MSASDIIHVFTMGYSKTNPHPLTIGILEILGGGGGVVKDPGNPDRRGVKLEKVFCRGHFDHG